MKILHQSLKDAVVARLRQDIIEGIHKPGTHLVEQTLADQYGVSRGPIRESILQLEQEGLVQVLPRRGTMVTEISPREAWEVYTLRGHLEALAVRSAALHWTEQQTLRMRALLTEMEPLGVNDWLHAIELDQQFHRVIVEASGNRTLMQLYHSMDSKVVACFVAVKRHLSAAPTLMAERHANLVAAFEQRDFFRAELLAAEHWSATAGRFRALIPAE
jgi:DNA-binding GntR family transcriptional regulator